MDNPQIFDTNTQNKSKKPILWIVLALVTLGLVACSFFLGRVLSVSENKTPIIAGSGSDQSSPQSWQKLTSNEEAIFVDKEDSNSQPFLSYYSLKKRQLVDARNVKYGYGMGGSELGKGSSSPTTAPNLLYTAFIGSDGNLWLISHQTQKTQQLTKNGFVGFISGWSPDSTKILYGFSKDTIATRNNVPDAPRSSKLQFKPQASTGLHIVDITTGSNSPLAAIEYTEGFIDNNRLLVRESGESESLAIFDIGKMEADQSTVAGKYGFGSLQYSFSDDGKVWAYTGSNHPTDDAFVAFGSFPQRPSVIIDSGAWAEVQSPLVSANGQKIVYAKREGYIGTGIPNQTTWIYDIASRKKAKLGTGQPQQWINDTTLLAKKANSKGYNGSLILIDTTTKEETLIYTYKN